MVINIDMQLFMDNLKMNRKKGQKSFWPSEAGIPTWIFMEGEGDEIKSKQASKRNRTLPGIG